VPSSEKPESCWYSLPLDVDLAWVELPLSL
jgi:hypothetical protein